MSPSSTSVNADGNNSMPQSFCEGCAELLSKVRSIHSVLEMFNCILCEKQQKLLVIFSLPGGFWTLIDADFLQSGKKKKKLTYLHSHHSCFPPSVMVPRARLTAEKRRCQELVCIFRKALPKSADDPVLSGHVPDGT